MFFWSCAEEKKLIKWLHGGDMWCGLTIDMHFPVQEVMGFEYAPRMRDIRQTLFRCLENSTMRLKPIASSFLVSHGGSRGKFRSADQSLKSWKSFRGMWSWSRLACWPFRDSGGVTSRRDGLLITKPQWRLRQEIVGRHYQHFFSFPL